MGKIILTLGFVDGLLFEVDPVVFFDDYDDWDCRRIGEDGVLTM